MKCITDHYRNVPKGLEENLKYRSDIVAYCDEHPEARESVIEACRQDPLFFFNVFLWTYDPHIDAYPVVPFITYEFQDKNILDIVGLLGNSDLTTEKSRDMGVTWYHLGVIFWSWMFHDWVSYLVASRSEDLVDKTDDKKTLFWKIDFMLEHLPDWMRPAFERRKLNLTNKSNNSSIDGESTNTGLGKGDRRTAVFLDEFAEMEHGDKLLEQIRDVTQCRLVCSTPLGKNHMWRLSMKSEIRKHRVHWSSHPDKGEGAYILDGKTRSPWYDKQCQRALSLREIARHLDISYDESEERMFSEALVEDLLISYAKPQIASGYLKYDDRYRKYEFINDVNGPLKIWFSPNALYGPPRDASYVCSNDVSMGKGGAYSSNSASVIYNERTGEKMAEYVTANEEPHAFAASVVDLCRWFRSYQGPAFMAWENNGPGGTFGKYVMSVGYTNVYYRKNEHVAWGKPTLEPGFRMSDTTKPMVLGFYNRALHEGMFFNRSEQAIKELRDYVIIPGGKVVHQAEKNCENPSSEGPNHGDLVIADAIACYIMDQRGLHKLSPPQRVAEPDITGTALERRLMHQEQIRSESRW